LNDNPYPTYFLATTALEEFWDTSKPLLFLGGWCRRYTRKSFWEPLRGEVLASPWQDKEQLGQAYHYVADLYERLLVVLAEALGHHHQVSYSHRYWRIILGPWLLFYLPVIYDRYTCLRTALENYPQVTSTGLPEECWVTPGDTLEFVQLIKEDLYNLQLYSRILKILGYDLPGKPYYAGSTRITVKKKAARWKRGLKKFLVAGLARGTACRSGQPIYLRDSYFSWPVELKLMIKTGGRVRPLFNGLAPTPRLTTNLSVRSSLQDVLPAKNEFE
jgi:putative transferase (TIGR04331 family)